MGTQGTLARQHISTQGTLTCEHVNTKDTLAREYVSTQGALTSEHVNTQGTLEGQVTCILKFVQRHFITSKLNAGCGGYLDKIYKILVDILDLKAGFPLANFFIRSDFFRSKTIKSRIGSYFFYFEKSR